MIFRPLNPLSQSGTARRAAAALLLSAAVVLSCAAPAHAGLGFGRPTIDAPERTAPEGGIFRFLLQIFGFTGGTMDPNGQS